MLVAAERGVASLDDLLADADQPAVAAVTIAELLVGVHLATGPVADRRRAWIAGLVEQLRVEPYDLRVAEAHAELLAHTRRTGRVRGAIDLIIAATAVATGRVVVTLDRTGFADLPGVVMR